MLNEPNLSDLNQKWLAAIHKWIEEQSRYDELRAKKAPLAECVKQMYAADEAERAARTARVDYEAALYSRLYADEPTGR